MKYTKKLHIEGLKLLLLQKNPSHYCPASLIEIKYNHFSDIQYLDDHVCPICRKFINIDSTLYDCPCNILKKGEAFKRTWIKLEKILDENDPFLNDPSFGNRDVFNDS